jgi:hypothetical protein
MGAWVVCWMDGLIEEDDDDDDDMYDHHINQDIADGIRAIILVKMMDGDPAPL